MKKLFMTMAMVAMVFTGATKKSEAVEVALGVTIGAGLSYTVLMATLASSFMHAEEALEIQANISEFDATGVMPDALKSRITQFVSTGEVNADEAFEIIEGASLEALQ